MIDLPAVYGDLTRPFTPEQLDRCYRDALRRGECDLPEGDPGLRPIGLLTTALPRINSITIAAYAIQIFPRSRDPLPEGDELDANMLAIVEEASTGALLRCHLAMDVELAARPPKPQDEDDEDDEDDDTEGWLPIVYESADNVLHALARADEEQAVHAIAQDAMRWAARSIDLLDQQHPDRVIAIIDTLGRLLPLTMFAELSRRHFSRA